MIVARHNPVIMEEVTDPIEIAESRIRRERFDRNWAWFQRCAGEIYQRHRGKIICVSGEQLFVAGTTVDVLTLAKAAFPEDDGRFTLIIPLESMERIYVAEGRVVRLQ